MGEAYEEEQTADASLLELDHQFVLVTHARNRTVLECMYTQVPRQQTMVFI